MITVIAATVRVYRLTARPLWADEILNSAPARLVTPADVVAWTIGRVYQLPRHPGQEQKGGRPALTAPGPNPTDRRTDSRQREQAQAVLAWRWSG